MINKMKVVLFSLLFIFSGIFLMASEPVKISGDMSHRNVYIDSHDKNNKRRIQKFFAERMRLQADWKSDNWDYKLGFSTLSSNQLTTSLVQVGYGGNQNLGAEDFKCVNAWAQYNSDGNWSARFGRMTVPFLRYKSELIWDNDLFWDGLYLTNILEKKNKISFHAGAFEVYRDLCFRNNKLYVVGLIGTPEIGKNKYEWRIDHFKYDFSTTRGWSATYAPDYNIVNMYGAVDFPNQIRLTLDLSRNLDAKAVGTQNKGGDAVNATIVIGKMKKNGNFQIISQYFQTGVHAVPGSFVSYLRRLNMSGEQFDLKYRIAKRTNIQLTFLEWKKLENSLSGDRSYRRLETSLNHEF
ncbi:MAG: putative porin [Candidatus Riflebacteria bacterium]|nr:putative porin [Candidatus Riflebacteria bacterium]